MCECYSDVCSTPGFITLLSLQPADCSVGRVRGGREHLTECHSPVHSQRTSIASKTRKRRLLGTTTIRSSEMTVDGSPATTALSQPLEKHHIAKSVNVRS